MDRTAARTRALMRGMHLNARLPLQFVLVSLAALALPAQALAATGASVVLKSNPSGETGNAVFTIDCGTISTPSPLPGFPSVESGSTGRVHYVTKGAGEDSDYTKTEGDVNCVTGETGTKQDVSVPIKEDSLDEPNQSFNLEISAGSPFGGTIDEQKKVATATIPDDDVPTVGIANIVQVVEGDSGSAAATLELTLSQPSWQTVEVGYSTSDYNATAGSDYTAVSGGTVSFAPGETKKSISLDVLGDTVAEDPAVEGFIVTLEEKDASKVKVDGAKKQAAVVIFDNEGPVTPVFSLGQNLRVTEGDSGTVDMVFTVTLSVAAKEKTQVAWKTANWTATHPRDYEGGQGILIFEAGETSKTITIKIAGDQAAEKTEAFGVILEGPVGGTLGQDKTLGIIDDNDQADGDGTATDGPKVKIGKPTRDRRRLATLLECPATATACNGKLVATARNGTLRVGRGSFELTSGSGTDLTFKMTRKAWRKLKKRSLRVKITVTAKDASGAVGTSVRTFRIKRRS